MRLSDPEQLLEQIKAAYLQCDENERLLVGIVGAPASGKSTLSEQLALSLNADQSITSNAIVVPMDGFHLDNTLLDERGQRSVKGSPQTFDVAGFSHLLQRLAKPVESVEPAQTQTSESSDDDAIYLPVFDRSMDLSRCAARVINPSDRLILVEGNYLLLNRPGWCDLHRLFKLSVFLDVPFEILQDRLVQRWLDHGLDEASASDRANSNDIPNAHVVVSESTQAHFVLGGMRQ